MSSLLHLLPTSTISYKTTRMGVFMSSVSLVIKERILHLKTLISIFTFNVLVIDFNGTTSAQLYWHISSKITLFVLIFLSKLIMYSSKFNVIMIVFCIESR